MLLKREILEGVVAGRVTLAFRRWRRPTVKAGGRLRTAIGELAIHAVEPIEAEQIRSSDARRAGFETREELLRQLGPAERGTLYRIALSLAGPDPRIALRKRARLTEAEREEIAARLARLDASSRHGPWTERVLGLIRDHPGRRAPDLAAKLGRDVAPFKASVRRLKELGLTESLEVGYRLSPRGRAWTATRRRKGGR